MHYVYLYALKIIAFPILLNIQCNLTTFPTTISNVKKKKKKEKSINDNETNKMEIK
jgi:hypothetical protein